MEEKFNILSDITVELNPLLEQLIANPHDNVVATKVSVLENEIVKLNSIDSMESFKKEEEVLKSKYKFLSGLDLDNDKLLVLYEIYSNYFKGLNDFKRIINDNKYLYLIANDLKDKNISIDDIKCEKDFDKVLDVLDEKHKRYEKGKEKYTLSIKNFKSYKYLDINEEIKNGTIYKKSVLQKYKGLGADSLIDKICEIIDEYNSIYSKKVFKSGKEKIDNKYIPRINSYIRCLVLQIEDYVRKAYYLNSKDLDMSMDINRDFLRFYYDIFDEMSKRDSDFKSLNRDINSYKSLLKFNDGRFFSFLSKVGIDDKELSEEEKRELLNIDKLELEALIFVLRTNNRIKKLYENNNMVKVKKQGDIK